MRRVENLLPKDITQAEIYEETDRTAKDFLDKFLAESRQDEKSI